MSQDEELFEFDEVSSFLIQAPRGKKIKKTPRTQIPKRKKQDQRNPSNTWVQMKFSSQDKMDPDFYPSNNIVHGYAAIDDLFKRSYQERLARKQGKMTAPEEEETKEQEAENNTLDFQIDVESRTIPQSDLQNPQLFQQREQHLHNLIREHEEDETPRPSQKKGRQRAAIKYCQARKCLEKHPKIKISETGLYVAPCCHTFHEIYMRSTRYLTTPKKCED